MTAVTLTRFDASLNMARYYRLDVQPDLFGNWSFVREWGRIGSGGQVRLVSYSLLSDANEAFALLKTQKVRRGYQQHTP